MLLFDMMIRRSGGSCGLGYRPWKKGSLVLGAMEEQQFVEETQRDIKIVTSRLWRRILMVFTVICILFFFSAPVWIFFGIMTTFHFGDVTTTPAEIAQQKFDFAVAIFAITLAPAVGIATSAFLEKTVLKWFFIVFLILGLGLCLVCARSIKQMYFPYKPPVHEKVRCAVTSGGDEDCLWAA